MIGTASKCNKVSPNTAPVGEVYKLLSESVGADEVSLQHDSAGRAVNTQAECRCCDCGKMAAPADQIAD